MRNSMMGGGRCVGFLVLLVALIGCVSAGAYPSPFERYRFIHNGDMLNPGVHQLATWISSQLRRNDVAASLDETPIYPAYHLPLQGKRNSEVTNAIIGSEETQKMYRDGRK